MRRLSARGGGVFVWWFACASWAAPLDSGPVMDFVPPAAGTYALHKIMHAPAGTVLDVDGRPRPLSAYTGGRVTLVSLMYASCPDPQGCPYALLALHQIKSQLEREPGLRERVRLVSLSFDPVRDPPAVMAAMRRTHAGAAGGVQWEFLTTGSHRELLPILKGFGQDVYVDLDPKTRTPRDTFSHVLRVYLIDPDKNIREIYTTSYLLPEIVVNDIKTLVLEEREAPK